MNSHSLYTYTPLTEDAKVLLETTSFEDSFSTSLRQHIDALWKQALSIHEKTLFNGPIAVFSHRESSCIYVQKAEYKTLTAMRLDPALAEELKLYPFGVSGLTCCKQAVLMGKRSSKVAYRPGFYECAPAGSLEPRVTGEERLIDVKKQLLSEFEEEVGLPLSCVEKVEPLALVLDKRERIYDICYRIRLTPEAQEQIPRETEEYYPLFWLQEREVSSFLKENQEILIHQTIALLSR